MQRNIILTGKEIEAVYSFYKEKQCNIAIIEEEWNSIGVVLLFKHKMIT